MSVLMVCDILGEIYCARGGCQAGGAAPGDWVSQPWLHSPKRCFKALSPRFPQRESAAGTGKSVKTQQCLLLEPSMVVLLWDFTGAQRGVRKWLVCDLSYGLHNLTADERTKQERAFANVRFCIIGLSGGSRAL